MTAAEIQSISYGDLVVEQRTVFETNHSGGKRSLSNIEPQTIAGTSL
jgi:hypothetical protein